MKLRAAKIGLAVGVYAQVLAGFTPLPVFADAVPAVASPALPGRTGFTLMEANRTGVAFTNHLSADRYLTNQIYLNGSGVAAGDMDGDGRCDLYFCGLDGPNALYRNLGDWRFEEVAANRGVACERLDCTGAAFADLDGDGDLDLIVNSIGSGTRVFTNDGHGRFEQTAVVNAGRAGHSLALADVDGDGDLDFYVVNYRGSMLPDAPGTRFSMQMREGRPVVVSVDGRPATEPDLTNRYVLDSQGRMTELGEPDAFFRNEGGGRFTPVPFTGGAFLDADGRPLTQPPYDWSLSVMFRDFNDDGAPDLYVCNDFAGPDCFWINDGTGRFRAAPGPALRSTSRFCMGMDAADIDRDGVVDIFTADMLSCSHALRAVQVNGLDPAPPEAYLSEGRPQYLRNVLQRGRGDGTFAEIARFTGVCASEWTWCPAFLDVDLDGYEDLLITNGNLRDSMNGDMTARVNAARQQAGLTRRQMIELNRGFPPLPTPNVAFRNRGDLTFEEVGAAWDYGLPGVSHGQALADLDNDGDLDVVINNLNGPAFFLRNDTAAPRLAVRLRGLPPNTRGIGAKITVDGRPVRQSQEVIAGGLYLSASDALRVFAAGSATNRLRVEVRWRSGRRTTLPNAEANHLFVLDEADAVPPTNAAREPEPRPLFEDVSSRLNHRHTEDAFDDFARQPLLPWKLSQSGPGVTWCDANGDGRDDLVIGSGNGGELALFANDGLGGFNRLRDLPLNYAVTRDQTTVLAWSRAPGQMALLAGSANYQDGLDIGPVARIYDQTAKAMDDSLPAMTSSGGPLCMADFDGDGDLDLFVGGRCVPGRYPEPADSLLFRNDQGRFQLHQRLEKIGLVTAAVFANLTGDARPELVLACEWGPLKIFRSDRSAWVPWDPPVETTSPLIPRPSSLSQVTGLWQGVAAVDLDSDGRLDLVAANWGLNTFHHASLEHPLRLYFGDFDDSGTVDVLEAGFDAESGKEVPLRGLNAVKAAMPYLAEKVTTFEAYGRSSVADLLGERMTAARRVEVNTLASLALLNRGDHVEARLLPAEAQFAPAFAVCAADFDGDGAEDVFLSQNLFAVNPDHWRYDAGRGLLLLGDGRGGLKPMPGTASGLLIYGEQRGAAVGDFDADGRPDLAVSQNGNATRLFRNAAARPGLRVRLNGPVANPTGVGAGLRLQFGERLGPARALTAGSGYWSQDSTVPVLATPQTPTAIQVRWPDGQATVSEVPAGSGEISVSPDGAVKRIR